MKHIRTIKHQEDNSGIVPVHAMKAYVEAYVERQEYIKLIPNLGSR